jgi:bifunctional DNA-binding transcriptional regulator/antitoxin component of YhaV-PrlF toxin-antitoxin module
MLLDKRSKKDVTVVTDRGQVSIPAHFRHELSLDKGKRVLWEKVSESELRVRILDEARPPGPAAMRGFARRFRDDLRTTADWMRELREGET